MVFEHSYEVALDRVDAGYEMTDKALLGCLEDIATMHSSSLNYDAQTLLNQDMTWVLIEWDLHVTRRPVYPEKLDIRTWCIDSSSRYALRDFEVYANGELCRFASSKWLIIETDTRKMVRMTDEMKRAYRPEERQVTDILHLPRMNVKESYDIEVKAPVRKADIDMNGHVHNLAYLDYMTEAEGTARKNRHVRITYRKEILPGEDVLVKMASEGDLNSFRLTSSEGTVFAMAETEV